MTTPDCEVVSFKSRVWSSDDLSKYPESWP